MNKNDDVFFFFDVTIEWQELQRFEDSFGIWQFRKSTRVIKEVWERCFRRIVVVPVLHSHESFRKQFQNG